MKISYDANTDVLSIVFTDTSVVTHELGEGFAAECDGEGRLTRVEIPNALSTSLGKDVFRQLVVEGIGPFAKNDPLIILPRLLEKSASTE
jgi:YD repeat-containing protein